MEEAKRTYGSAEVENELATLKMLLLDRDNEILKLRREETTSNRNTNTGDTERETYELLLSEKDYEIEMLSSELQRVIKRS